MTASTMDEDWVEVNDKVKMPIRSAQKSAPKVTREPTLRFYRQIQTNAIERLSADPSPIFHTTMEGSLYDTFLDSLPADLRTEYTCNACKKFVERHGDLVQVDKHGDAVSLFWSGSKFKEPFKAGVAAMNTRFRKCRVSNEFKVRSTKVGTEGEPGGFKHMTMAFPSTRVQKAEFKGFALPATSELSQMLDRVLNDYNLETVRRATKILEENKLPHADNHKAAARWLLNVLEAPMPSKTEKAVEWHNFTYRTAAQAFIGCLSQLRTGALSTLLDNIKVNLPWKAIEQQWKDLTDPIQYLRPQAAPKEGNILASEKLFEQMGLSADDMRRRFLVQDDIPDNAVIWRTPSVSQKSKGALNIFADVKPREKQAVNVDVKYELDTPATKITFAKLINKVLPQAKKLEYRLESRNAMFFIITGLQKGKPIMQWHDESNQASWYVYHNPRPVHEHNLKQNAWNTVNAVIPLPHLWDGVPLTTTFPVDEDNKELKYYHKKNGLLYMFCMDSIIDKNANHLCLFPTLLKGEFHGARATIESFSNKMKKEYVDDAEKKGGYVGGPIVSKSKSGEQKHMLRVTDFKGEVGAYEIVLFD